MKLKFSSHFLVNLETKTSILAKVWKEVWIFKPKRQHFCAGFKINLKVFNALFGKSWSKSLIFETKTKFFLLKNYKSGVKWCFTFNTSGELERLRTIFAFFKTQRRFFFSSKSICKICVYGEEISNFTFSLASSEQNEGLT